MNSQISSVSEFAINMLTSLLMLPFEVFTYLTSCITPIIFHDMP